MYRAHEFQDWFGRDLAASLRIHDGAIWYPKVEGRAERLAYLLGGDECNIAEVRPAPASWNLGRDAVIVRIAQQYELEDLAIKELDAAVAAELVFSMWIRRRDTHAFNRVYVDGVPVFFDHHIAFGMAEPMNRSPRWFFRDGPDGGYVSRWRIVSTAEVASLATIPIRRLNKEANYAVHAIDDVEGFAGRLGEWGERIGALDLSDLEEVVEFAGYQGIEVAQICHLLRASQRALPAMVGRACTLIREPVFVGDTMARAAG
jgi:hypothetical protein